MNFLVLPLLAESEYAPSQAAEKKCKAFFLLNILFYLIQTHTDFYKT